MRWFEQMQERITGFVAGHSGITAARYSELKMCIRDRGMVH